MLYLSNNILHCNTYTFSKNPVKWIHDQNKKLIFNHDFSMITQNPTFQQSNANSDKVPCKTMKVFVKKRERK